jgi:glutamate-ammonia-ligase adenylyltransferase
LSLLAESLVEAVLQLSLSEMENRHGRLPGPQLAVIGYGSLGARALGFDSDLDLIFLYRATDERSDGTRPLSAERYHTGVARRLLSLMSANTSSGRLYSIDARLRPNGRSGLLVSSLEAFRRYQMEEAWIWELQALTRARAVAGSVQAAEAFTAIRQQVLTVPRDKTTIHSEIAAMRDRIRQQHEQSNQLKHGDGGLLDIEFVVQLGLLLNAAEFPEIIKSTEMTDQLKALHKCNWINTHTFNALQDTYQQLTLARQQLALLDAGQYINFADLTGISRALCKDILG